MVKINIEKDVDISINTLKEAFGPRGIAEFCEKKLTDLIALSEKNLGAGRQIDGQSMPKDYSSSYKRYLRSIRENLTVDLRLTGQLLRNRRTKQITDGAEMYFTGSHSTRRPSSSSRRELESSPSRPSRPRTSGSTATRQASSSASSSRPSRPRRRGGGGEQNATIAASLMDRGYEGWHEVPEKIFEDWIDELLEEAVSKILK